MKGIILAAGRGSRMGNLTDERPKCLIQLKGKTLLERQLAAFKNAGISDIAIVTGYKREQLLKYELKEFHNSKWEETNMVSSLVCAEEWVTKYSCIVSYSDIFYTSKAISLLINSKKDLSITYDPNWLELWSKRFSDPLVDAETFKINIDGVVIEIGKKPDKVDEIQGQYMGLILITPNSWGKIKIAIDSFSSNKRNTLDMTTLLQRVIEIGDLILHGLKFEGEWGEIDTINDLHAL